MSDAKLVEVYRAKDSIQANLLKARLEDAGIPAQIEGEMLDALAGAVPFRWPTSPRLLVSEADAPRARTILMEIEHETGASDA